MLEQLQQLGLNEEESTLYVAMLELGGGQASRLAKRTGRKRSSTYHTLARLCERGLASYTNRGKVRYFSPEPPERIVELARQRLEKAEAFLPELRSIQNTLSTKPRIQFFETKEDIEQVFQDTLTAKGEILGCTNLSLLADVFPGYFRRYTRARMQRGIRVRYLCPRSGRDTDLVEELFPRGIDGSLLELLFVNPQQYPFKNDIAIYGNKVSIMSLSPEDSIAVLIESASTAESMRAFFDLAWMGASSFVAG